MACIQEKRFDYNCFPCVVLFQSMGHRTGYVGIPKTTGYMECIMMIFASNVMVG